VLEFFINYSIFIAVSDISNNYISQPGGSIFLLAIRQSARNSGKENVPRSPELHRFSGRQRTFYGSRPADHAHYYFIFGVEIFAEYILQHS
jgi:hypothetical protein